MAAVAALTLDQIKANILRDIAGQREGAVLTSDSDESVRASGNAAAIEGLYSHQQWVLRQQFPQTAEAPYLDMHCELRAGMTRKGATIASGTITFAGSALAPVPSGTEMTLGGLRWITTASITLDETGAGTATAQAEAVGSAGNLDAGTVLQLAAAPVGVTGATVELMGGGTNIETDDELRARLLFALQNPDGAGTPTDYKKWAMEVPGVTQAYVYPRRRGLGTTDVAITSAGGLPSPDLIALVLAYIEIKGPAEADKRVFAPTLRTVDGAVSVAYTGMTLDEARAAVLAAVTAFFAGLAPGDTLVVARLSAAIMAIDGITDVAISAPASNVVPAATSLVVEWLRVGTWVVSSL